MSVEDKKIARDLVRELNRRRSLDIREAKVTVQRCVGTISGILRPAMGEVIDPKAEIKALQDNARRIGGLRELVIEARFELAPKT